MTDSRRSRNKTSRALRTSQTDSQKPPSDARQKIGAFFKSWRIQAGLTIQDTAEALRLDDSSLLLRYETGQEALPLDLLFSLTNLFNIPPDETLGMIHDSYGNLKLHK